MKINFFTLALVLGSALANAQSYTQIVDLSTGVTNGSTSLIAVGSADDTWTVKEPGGSTYGPVLVSNGTASGFGAYPSTSAARWIAPHTITTAGGTYGQIPSTPEHIGWYFYKTTFVKGPCSISAHPFITFSGIAGDNQVEGFYINNSTYGMIYHDLNLRNIHFGSLVSFTESINMGQLVNGVNEIIFVVHNEGSYTGLYIDAKLSITYPSGNPFITPSIAAGPTTFCAGSPLTFTGSSNTTATNTYWEMTESDAAGVPVSGGYTWNNWATGSPGTFTFPNPTCGKYYRVKLAVQNGCISWAETAKVIYINCLPDAYAGDDVTICSGGSGCATIGVTSTLGHGITYQWTGPSGVIANTQTVTVCPTTTTTYTYTVTNTATGCSATDLVTVTYVNNSPVFNVFVDNTTNPTFATVTAYPGNTGAYSVPGFYYSLEVQELDGSSNPYYTDSGTNEWWDFSGHQFRGFVSTGTGTFTQVNWWPSTPSAPGKFLFGHTYRIKRTTWNDYCPQQTFYINILPVKSLMTGNSSLIAVAENAAIPDGYVLDVTSVNDLSAENTISVYPNPGTGVFTLETSAGTKANIDVYDALGKKVKALEQNGFKSVIDLTGFTKGIYMINIVSEGKLISKKIILE